MEVGERTARGRKGPPGPPFLGCDRETTHRVETGYPVHTQTERVVCNPDGGKGLVTSENRGGGFTGQLKVPSSVSG